MSTTNPPDTAQRDALRASRKAKKIAKQQHRNEPSPALSAWPVPPAAPPAAPTSRHDRSKAELRAERRAQQEQQRQTKLAARSQEQTHKLVDKLSTSVSRERRPQAEGAGPGGECASWFRHLQPCAAPTQLNTRELAGAGRLSAALRAGAVAGADARCVAFLNALQQVARSAVLGSRVESARALQTTIQAALLAVSCARPPTPAIHNAVAHLRAALAALPHDVSERDAKCELRDAVDTYIRDQVETARHAISLAVRRKLCSGDTVLTFGCSSLVEQVVTEAWRAGVALNVLVVGTGRLESGAGTLVRRLGAAGLPTSCADITALSYVMPHVDKVLLGCGALLADGSVLGRAGTAQTALAAAAHNVPVLVCCETHKFSERVQTDAFVYNELDARAGAGWARLVYDVTPPALVTCVVTELAVLPCTSAPVVLRFKLGAAAF